MNFHQRLKKLRTQKSLSKSDLANKIGVHYSQIGRYEDKGSMPSADVMTKLANSLEVTSDFLMNGNTDEFAENSLTDKELLNLFKTIEKLPREDKSVVKIFLDAFITKKQIQQIVA
ncbi:MAG: helix-turn-helix domain-containing protein [Flavobacteriaceae bacterium]|nr:MAG: helix-turn-helix domain-containing protein [Flavobacteriaceae bacterium]